jgi:hypothetical protein
MSLFEDLEKWKKENPAKFKHVQEILKINEELDKLEGKPMPPVAEAIWTGGTPGTATISF